MKKNLSTEKVKIIKYKKITQKQFLNEISALSKKQNIKLTSIEFKGKNVKLSVKGEVQQIFHLLESLFLKFDCKSYILQYLDQKLHLAITINLKTVQDITQKKIDFVNPYEKSLQTNGIAIVDNTIFYNSTWLNVGDNFENGVIEKIEQKGFIVKIDNNTTKYIGLENEK